MFEALRDWAHDRDHVRLLQHAHADQIESRYRELLSIPGNPDAVLIRQFGTVRTFIASGRRLENRAIFSGQETHGQIDEVLRHFADNAANCVIEVNAANYYVDPPASWEQRLLKHLLTRGCVIDGFRCVWCCCDPLPEPPPEPQQGASHRLVRFGADEHSRFEELRYLIDPREKPTPSDRVMRRQPGWSNYIAFDGDRPCAFGTLFVNGPTAYLAYWYTHPEHRGRGLQQEGVRRRVRDAFASGCRCVFSVTDFNYASPRNLQRCGFQLAYNYLLVRRDPLEVKTAVGAF